MQGAASVGGTMNLKDGREFFGDARIGASTSAFMALTPSSKDTGVSGSIYGAYNPAGSNVNLYGSLFASRQQQRLTLGQFNEQTEKSSVLQVTLGAQINKNWSVEAGYTRVSDALNFTRNNNIISIGAKYTF